MGLRRLPPWIRSCLPSTSALSQIHSRTYAKGLRTVCKEARCPNQGECASRGTATFLILGDICTRNCSFCAVNHGRPRDVQVDEPKVVAASAITMGLKHAVITSVARDDLPDGGASVFAETVSAIRRRSGSTTVEVLIPDFQGSEEALQAVINSGPDIINHNLETVRRLYPVLRQGASYQRSLTLLKRVKAVRPSIITKSGIMVGVGETRAEVIELARDLVKAGCTILTIGQYLQPTSRHYPVARFIPPEEFEELEYLALAAGMKKVAAGPLVRSSYRAGEIVEELKASTPSDSGSPAYRSPH